MQRSRPEIPAWLQARTTSPLGWVAVPAGYFGLLLVGVIARAAGDLRESGTLVLAAVLMSVLAAASNFGASVVLAALGWVAVLGFSDPPFGQLHLHQPHAVRDGVFLLVATTASTWIGTLIRRSQIARPVSRVGRESGTLGDMPADLAAEASRPGPAVSWRARARGLTTAVSGGRQLLGLGVAVVVLPLITAALVQVRSDLALADELLIYLVAIVAVSLIGGLVPAVLAAVAASLLLNWFFTPPLRGLTIDAPQNLLALMLFVLVAVIVSATVHVAARRASLAARSEQEATVLLALARTVLQGDDTPAAIMEHLTETLGIAAELQERSGSTWITVARSATFDAGSTTIIPARDDVRLEVAGDTTSVSRLLLDGFAAQAAAALDRERLRIQASQSEALAEGNRIRTALLTAVSHDLRTPLASVKASVSSMRQADLVLSEADRAELLATIEEGADRLDALIGNLLDLSRLNTGSLQPFLRPTSLEEIAPMTLLGLDHGEAVQLDIPEDLPYVITDPGLLDRVLANLVSNAIRYSPPRQPPMVRARANGHTVLVEVIDHGSGIPAGTHHKIFEPFQRLGDQSRGTGVGLGLAVAKGFTEAMGGRLTALDTARGGLTMQLILPAADTHRQRAVLTSQQ